jgi:ArsR family transcriptional regulator, arsenate/arsenite/antimonite-responsive transcriptional repressor
MDNIYETNAKIFKAFCDESRLRILERLQGGEKCACTLLEQLPIGQSTLSHHMKILIDSGVVSPRKEGKWMYYSLSETGCQTALELLGKLLTKSVEQEIECQCE